MITIYHNPRCQKSRAALTYIESIGDAIMVVDYLKTPPTITEIKSILKKLKIKPENLIRTKEELYKSTFKGKQFTDEQWIKILSEHPILIERPIILKGTYGVIGRDEESLKKIH
ncbi:MAG: arsenate reductase (glutaredoxin) [Cytophagales bacterium]|nr:arsenate reductase (glutaredoxin) [Cytophaga sp.]